MGAPGIHTGHDMERTPVDSSTIVSAGYDPASHTLEVEFRNGAVYQYSGVPESMYRGLLSPPSHGTYLNTVIKKEGYPYRKV